MNKVKLAIIGSRGFTDYEKLCHVISKYFYSYSIEYGGPKEEYLISEIISGGCVGADLLGEKFAKENNIPTRIFYPEWDKYGKSAGFRRNEDIVSNCTVLLAFWDSVSRGTQNSLQIAKRLKKETIIIYV